MIVYNCYEVHISYLWQDDGKPVESSMTRLFTAIDDTSAIDDAVRWARCRMKNIQGMRPGAELGCIKIAGYQIGGIDGEGMGETRRDMDFFEWKCDCAGTLDDWVTMKKNQMEKVLDKRVSL